MTQAQYTAIVTGGSTGIGEDICRKMLDQGYTVISMARNVLPWTHERLHCVQVDLLDAVATEKAAKDIAERFEVTHFIHNAGVIWPALLDEVKLEDLQGLTQIHLGAALQITQAVVPGMRERHFGRIVLMSSRGALGLQTRTAYAATKAGMLGMARTWALELAPYGITVNAVSPGPIETELFRANHPVGSEAEQRSLSSIPLGRFGQAAEVAAAVTFLLSDEAAYITGQNLGVDGGGSLAGR